jgi:hypothetical protein
MVAMCHIYRLRAADSEWPSAACGTLDVETIHGREPLQALIEPGQVGVAGVVDPVSHVVQKVGCLVIGRERFRLRLGYVRAGCPDLQPGRVGRARPEVHDRFLLAKGRVELGAARRCQQEGSCGDRCCGRAERPAGGWGGGGAKRRHGGQLTWLRGRFRGGTN